MPHLLALGHNYVLLLKAMISLIPQVFFYSITPDMDTFIGEYLKSTNDAATEYNDKIESERFLDLFQQPV